MGFNIALEDVQGQAKSPFRPISSISAAKYAFSHYLETDIYAAFPAQCSFFGTPGALL